MIQTLLNKDWSLIGFALSSTIVAWKICIGYLCRLQKKILKNNQSQTGTPKFGPNYAFIFGGIKVAAFFFWARRTASKFPFIITDVAVN